MYVRGHPLDFDRWEEEGAKGWAYRDVLPYFRRAERWRGAPTLSRPEGRWRRARPANPLYDAFIEAGRQAGYPVSADLNGEQQEGFGRFDMTVKDGVRWSAANAYLRPAMKRPNLAVVTHALRDASRLRGPPRRRRAHYRARRARTTGARAARSDLVRRRDQFAAIAEALGRRPGGGAARARAFRVIADLPGVGENLQDHLEFYFQVASKQPITLYCQDRAARARR